MISLHEILSEERVKLRSARDGQHYTTCPQCSAGRKAGNRRKRCFEPKGVELRLWNEGCLTDECSQETPLVICEGEFDACSWMVAGATHVVSVPNGAAGKPGEGVIDPIDDRQFAYLWDGGKLRGDLKAFKKIVIATDADMPGLILRDEIAIRLGRPRCWYVAYPQGCKDANDVLMRHGREALSKVLADAKPIVPDTLVSFSDISSRADAPCLSSGWVGLDPHFKIAPPQLIVVTGKPNHGKSQWALALVANLARLRGLKGAILQFEDNPERNRRDLLRYARSWANQGDVGISGSPEDWVDRMFRVISPREDLDEEKDFDLEWLKDAIEEAATRHGCRWVLIDPWNEVEHLWGRQDTEATYLNRAIRHLKRPPLPRTAPRRDTPTGSCV